MFQASDSQGKKYFIGTKEKAPKFYEYLKNLPKIEGETHRLVDFSDDKMFWKMEIDLSKPNSDANSKMDTGASNDINIEN